MDFIFSRNGTLVAMHKSPLLNDNLLSFFAEQNHAAIFCCHKKWDFERRNKKTESENLRETPPKMVTIVSCVYHFWASIFYRF